MASLKKTLLTLLIAVLVISGSASSQTVLSSADESAIQAKVVLLHDQWNRHDMAGYTSNMTEDVQWINVVGAWWKGKSQVFGTLDQYHKTIFKERQLYPAEKLAIRQIAPNVIVSTMINPADAYTNSLGVKQPPTRNMLTLIWVKQNGAWLIAQAQNTIEAPAAPPKQN